MWVYQPNFLFIAYVHIVVQFLLCTFVPVYAFLDEDGLDGGVSEDDSCREEAVYYCCGDLNYMGRG